MVRGRLPPKGTLPCCEVARFTSLFEDLTAVSADERIPCADVGRAREGGRSFDDEMKESRRRHEEDGRPLLGALSWLDKSDSRFDGFVYARRRRRSLRRSAIPD